MDEDNAWTWSLLNDFVKNGHPKDVHDEFVSSVTSIKTEAHLLGVPYDCYHPYYLVVYETIKKLFELDLVIIDHETWGRLLSIWRVAEKLYINKHATKETFQFSRYVTTRKLFEEMPLPFILDDAQTQRYFRRLVDIMESIREDAVAHGIKIGLEQRLAFFYSSLSVTQPCLMEEMNKFWARFLEKLPVKSNPGTKFKHIPSVISAARGYLCVVCQFKTQRFKDDIEFYKHAMTTHSLVKIECSSSSCDASFISLIAYEEHLKNRHYKFSNLDFEFQCSGCQRVHQTATEASICEADCKLKHANRKASPYRWEKYLACAILADKLKPQEPVASTSKKAAHATTKNETLQTFAGASCAYVEPGGFDDEDDEVEQAFLAQVLELESKENGMDAKAATETVSEKTLREIPASCCSKENLSNHLKIDSVDEIRKQEKHLAGQKRSSSKVTDNEEHVQKKAKQDEPKSTNLIKQLSQDHRIMLQAIKKMLDNQLETFTRKVNEISTRLDKIENSLEETRSQLFRK